ncbi:MAG: RNase adapter RapZ [Gammaproteobacteria bacterium]|nr:RNase adapter RapZ [Gammaproteobacteria bacterium]MBU2678264.1 RNase adapter RapZ [Gammaproteobacteria bacterium]NNC58226.1 RNase adapter RapZ [Woeseiaceae bacterium]NNL51999.1 RNase adapter RapZ [Woeseiaceae bacterium]
MSNELRLIIVSGLSGSGKTVALHVLEDLGYYCIDNLPAALLKAAVREVRSRGKGSAKLLAVGVDARARTADLSSLPELLRELEEQEVVAEIIFLHASDEILLKRYGETRRRHPLAEQGTELHAAIDAEREILAEIHNAADLIIDTSQISIYELADILRARVDRRQTEKLSVLIQSFGFKHGIPADADFVFDLRSLPNPYWTLELRGFTGLDKEVSDFLNAQPSFTGMFEDIRDFLERWIPHYQESHRGYLTVALGCTGGQHRSVCMTEKLAATLRATNDPVLVRHNSLTGHRLKPD